MNTRCQFCGFYYTPPDFHRIPSQTCDACYLKIAEGLGREPTPPLLQEEIFPLDFLPASHLGGTVLELPKLGRTVKP